VTLAGAELDHDSHPTVVVLTTGLVLVDFQSSHPVVVVLTTGLVDDEVDFQSSQLAELVEVTLAGVLEVELHGCQSLGYATHVLTGSTFLLEVELHDSHPTVVVVLTAGLVLVEDQSAHVLVTAGTV